MIPGKLAKPLAGLLVAAVCTVIVLAGHHPANAMLKGDGSSGDWPSFDANHGRHDHGGQGGGGENKGSSAGRFRISGAVNGFYPGSKSPLVLTVLNPQPFPIVVTSIQTAVGNASPVCGASYFSVAAFSGDLTVPAHGSAQVSVAAAMSHAAPNGCQGVVFPLHYSGLARKA